ncbi:MAG: cation diffusion facilitator family transporter, partial [Lachnospiraceae bacterium]|nr:cation diffusion facilitator family transporter [Lachnospiraceae bacterium]
ISKKIQSEAIRATALDSLSDTLATSVVLISTLIAHYTPLRPDGICGILVGLFIFYSGIISARDTLNPLLGQAPDPEFVKEIESLVLSYEGVLGIHDLIVHNYGPGRLMISLHAEVPADGDILELHDMVDNIERTLQDKLSCNAVIHMDPVCTNDPVVNSLKAEVASYLLSLDESLSIHDFRIVKGPTHTNIIFDILLPYKFKLNDDEVRQLVSDHIKSLDENYFAVINIDNKFA